MAETNNKDGRWVTLDNGVHLFIKKGQTLDDAIEKLNGKPEKPGTTMSEESVKKLAKKEGYTAEETEKYIKNREDEGYTHNQAKKKFLDDVEKDIKEGKNPKEPKKDEGAREGIRKDPWRKITPEEAEKTRQDAIKQWQKEYDRETDSKKKAYIKEQIEKLEKDSIDSTGKRLSVQQKYDIEKYANHYGYSKKDAEEWVERAVKDGKTYNEAVEAVKEKMANYLGLAPEYKGYAIEKNFYGNGEYSVQYAGDDFIFASEEDAKKFIDEMKASEADTNLSAREYGKKYAKVDPTDVRTWNTELEEKNKK